MGDIFKRMRLGAIDQQPGAILGLRAGKRLKPLQDMVFRLPRLKPWAMFACTS